MRRSMGSPLIQWSDEVLHDSSETSLRIEESDSLIEVHTGTLSATISKQSFNLFQTARVGSVEIIPQHSSAGFAVMTPDRKHYVSTRDRNCTVRIEESHPDHAVVSAHGRHAAMPGAVGTLLDFEVRMTFSAGESRVLVDYEVTHNESEVELQVRGIGYAFRVALGAVEDGRVWTAAGELPLTEEGHTLLYTEPLDGDHPNWLAWHGPNGGLAIALPRMAATAPKSLRVRPTGFSVGFHPEVNDPGGRVPMLKVLRGEKLRYSTRFDFLSPEVTREDVVTSMNSSETRSE